MKDRVDWERWEMAQLSKFSVMSRNPSIGFAFEIYKFIHHSFFYLTQLQY